MDFEIEISFVNDTPFTVDVTIDNNPDFEVNIQFGQDTSEELGIQDIIDQHIVIKSGAKLGDSGKVITDFEPAKGSDNNYVTDVEKANLHAPHSDNQVGDGVTITGEGTETNPYKVSNDVINLIYAGL